MPQITWKTGSYFGETVECFFSVTELGDGKWYALVTPYDGSGAIAVGYFPTPDAAKDAVEEYVTSEMAA